MARRLVPAANCWISRVLRNEMIRRLRNLLLGVALLFIAGAEGAQSPAHPGTPNPAEAQHLIDVLQDPQKRAELIETLQALARAVPPAADKPAGALMPNECTIAAGHASGDVIPVAKSSTDTWPYHA